MSDLPPSHATPYRTSRRLALVAAGVLVLLATWVIWKFGGFDLMTTLEMDGRRQSVVNTFATVDHPFHATRGETLLQSLRDGEILRWVAHHQGGYPVEFYPLGIPWLDVGLWAVLLGQFPIIAVHKLTVLVVFVLPAVGFWWLARGDNLNPFVPVLALAIQVATPGLWWTGGMIELIEWGLVANVGGATLAFLAMAALARYALEGQARFGVAAMLASSAALYTNTRSGIAVAIAAIAVLASVTLDRDPERRVPLRRAFRRVALVALVSGLLAAPLLLSLLRYADLYYFVNFKEYMDLGEFWHDTLASVSRPLFGAAVAGVILAVTVRRLSVLRIVAVSGLLYAGLTALLSSGGLGEGVIQQLETTRLMPFQRLLVVYLSAAAIGYGLDWVARKRLKDRSRTPLVSALLVLSALAVMVSFDGEFGDTPENHYTTGKPHALTTGREEFVEISAILAEANEVVPGGRAIYVVEDRESWWHEQLWGPTQSDAPFYYDDWMWYWHPDFDAPYNYRAGHFIPNPVETFNADWLSSNGIGALVVTDRQIPSDLPDPRQAAAQNPLFEHQVTVGDWDLYLVQDATAIVSNGDLMPDELTIRNQSIQATFESAGGLVEIRRNWFPRWEAFADGQQVDVIRTQSGYMEITVPDATQAVELRYAVTWSDWLGRFAAVLGLVVATWLGVGRQLRVWLGHRGRQDA